MVQSLATLLNRVEEENIIPIQLREFPQISITFYLILFRLFSLNSLGT